MEVVQANDEETPGLRCTSGKEWQWIILDGRSYENGDFRGFQHNTGGDLECRRYNTPDGYILMAPTVGSSTSKLLDTYLCLPTARHATGLITRMQQLKGQGRQVAKDSNTTQIPKSPGSSL
eukprot:Gb_32972 [translate_table: standard]